MKKILTTAFFGVMLGWFALPAAALDEGFYLGASLGQASFEQKELDEIDIDDDSSAWKVFGGIRWGVLAIEGGYVDFGDVDDRDGPLSRGVEASGFDAFGVVSLPLGPVDLFGKVGGIYWDTDDVVNGRSNSDDGVDLAYGAGVAVRLGSASVRLEYEAFDIDALDDLNMYSVGVAWTF